MTKPTYPLDRRILEIIMELTGTTQEVKLDQGKKATSKTYKDISSQVADGAWKMKLRNNENANRPTEYDPLDINTWKRIFGHTRTDGSIMGEGKSPSDDTLMQIMLYLGYNNWEDFEKEIDEVYQRVVIEYKSVHENIDREEVFSRQMERSGYADLKVGDELEVHWPKSSGYDFNGDAFMKIFYLGCGRFRVNAVQNCSLKHGDEFEVVCMEEGEKLYLINLIRNRRPIGYYVSGDKVTSIKKYPKR
ncbi:MAG: hypothetical protein IKV15_07125 [Bacteroidaceae bacterium]|nr:hypothetical protein [Bacteroidaceae bacterium]